MSFSFLDFPRFRFSGVVCINCFNLNRVFTRRLSTPSEWSVFAATIWKQQLVNDCSTADYVRSHIRIGKRSKNMAATALLL